jgi:hypothetical protein
MDIFLLFCYHMLLIAYDFFYILILCMGDGSLPFFHCLDWCLRGCLLREGRRVGYTLEP